MEELKFEWDEGNKNKSVNKHGIANNEAESVFYDKKRIINLDLKHSKAEKRYTVIGNSFLNRILFVVFTFRNGKIRIISSRLANKKNRREYDTKTI